MWLHASLLPRSLSSLPESPTTHCFNLWNASFLSMVLFFPLLELQPGRLTVDLPSSRWLCLYVRPVCSLPVTMATVSHPHISVACFLIASSCLLTALTRSYALSIFPTKVFSFYIQNLLKQMYYFGLFMNSPGYRLFPNHNDLANRCFKFCFSLKIKSFSYSAILSLFPIFHLLPDLPHSSNSRHLSLFRKQTGK